MRLFFKAVETPGSIPFMIENKEPIIDNDALQINPVWAISSY